jgi:hypothetical protein
MAETNGNLFIGSLVMIVVVAVIVTIILIALKEEDSSTEQVVQAVAVGFPTVLPNNPTNGPTLLYSYDGKKWNESTGSSFNYKVANGFYSNGGVNFGNNKWVATGWNRNTDVNILYSNNGINWKEANRNDGMSIFYNGGPSDVRERGNKVAYGKDKWVAVGKDENNENILYSTDGISWYVAEMLSPGQSTFPGAATLDGAKGIAYGNNRWVAVGKADGNIGNILYSDNGISWQRALMSDGTSPFISSDNSAGLNVSYDSDNDLWLAVGRVNNDNNLLISNDGISWVVRNATLEGGSFFARGCYDIIYSSEKDAYIATGSNGGSEEENIAFSTNGISWQAGSMSNGISFPFKSNVNGLTVNYSNNLNLWFATGGNDLGVETGTIITSTNGISWDVTKMTNGTSYPFGTTADAVAFDLAVRN